MLPDWFDKMRTTGWLQILKALPFEGGPSSAKWVYLSLNAVLAFVVLAFAMTICFVYIHTPDHHADSGMLLAIASMLTVLTGCATAALNYRRKVNAQVITNDKPIASALTPVTMSEPGEK